MEHDYMKRGFLLPEGCKDLNDVLMQKRKRAHYQLPARPKQFEQLPKGFGAMIKPRKQAAPLPPVKGELIVSAEITVSKLATLLRQKPLLIVADLMQMGVFASGWQLLGFEAISRVSRKYGFIARKAA